MGIPLLQASLIVLYSLFPGLLNLLSPRSQSPSRNLSPRLSRRRLLPKSFLRLSPPLKSEFYHGQPYELRSDKLRRRLAAEVANSEIVDEVHSQEVPALQPGSSTVPSIALPELPAE